MRDEDKKQMIKHNMINRAPGKRQIKPTAYLLNCDIPLDDDEDDDYQAPSQREPDSGGDVAVKSGEEENGENEGEDSSSGSEDDSDEDEEESEEDESEEEETAASENELICSVCMNLHDFIAPEAVIQCDRCGIQVHECCYGGIFLEDQNGSNSESWFCEPCILGLDNSKLHCELCHSTTGAFKLSEFPGQFIHMVCALFTENVTWADNQNLIGASYQEVKHKFFGRKGCAGCNEWRESRTGVASRCELGECRSYYHVTCAQRLGLLVETAEEEGVVTHPRFIACKSHNRNSDKVKKQRELYSRWHAREKQRSEEKPEVQLSAKMEKDRVMLKEKLDKAFEDLNGVSITKPDPYSSKEIRQRYVRLLHTSSRLLEGFKLKASLYRPLLEQNGVVDMDDKSEPNGVAPLKVQIARLTKENQKIAASRKAAEKERDKAVKEHEKYNLKYKQRKVQARRNEERDNVKLKKHLSETKELLETKEVEASEFAKLLGTCGLSKELLSTLGEPPAREEDEEDVEDEAEEHHQKRHLEQNGTVEHTSPKRSRKSGGRASPEQVAESSSDEETFIILSPSSSNSN